MYLGLWVWSTSVIHPFHNVQVYIEVTDCPDLVFSVFQFAHLHPESPHEVTEDEKAYVIYPFLRFFGYRFVELFYKTSLVLWPRDAVQLKESDFFLVAPRQEMIKPHMLGHDPASKGFKGIITASPPRFFLVCTIQFEDETNNLRSTDPSRTRRINSQTFQLILPRTSSSFSPQKPFEILAERRGTRREATSSNLIFS